MRLIVCMVYCAWLCASHANAQETQNLYPLQGVTFARQSLPGGAFNLWRTEHYSYGSAKLPSWNGAVHGREHFVNIMATNRPAGTNVMWGAWTFMSRGLFSSNPGSHVGFIMRALSTGISNIGEGFIVGGISGFSWSEGGACAAGTRSQPETWHEMPDGSAGNRLVGGSACGPLLEDWKRYSVVAHAAHNGYSYSIYDSATNALLFSAYVPNENSPSSIKLEKATGWSVGIVFANTPYSNWEFEISEISLGWF